MMEEASGETSREQKRGKHAQLITVLSLLRSPRTETDKKS